MGDEPAIKILSAIHRALYKNGYANLTTQEIVAASDTNRAIIHHHYDRKETLLATFLDFFYDRDTDGSGSVTSTTSEVRP